MTPLLFVAVIGASYRISRFVIEDDWPPVHRFRSYLFSRWGEDDAWASGLRCYWCIGTIITAALVTGLSFTISIPLPAIWGAAACTGTGLLSEAVDTMTRR